MRKIQLLHNTGAGNEEHNKKELVSSIEKSGYECIYTSTKQKGWNIENDAELLAIAGGDGTFRKVVKKLLKEKESISIPLTLLPLGTANNVSKTMDITGDVNSLITEWKNYKVRPFDVGAIRNVNDENFFLEGMGFGIFPYLMMEMKSVDEKEIPTVEQELLKALQLLYKIVLSYEPRYAELKVDDTDHSGNFILIEVMNTRSIGPNLYLSPLSDPGDGEFEVVLIPADHKDKFAEYIFNKMKGKEETYSFHTLKAKNVTIKYQGKHVHVDDKVVKMDKSKDVKIQLQKGVLNFLAPVPKTEEAAS